MAQPRRDWSAAREKVEREGACRVGHPWWRSDKDCRGPLEAAHIVGREHDKEASRVVVGDLTDWLNEKPNLVEPVRIVPLCRKHHRMYDAHQLDLLGYLTAEEEAQAVLDAGSLESARRRLCPSEYRKEPLRRRVPVVRNLGQMDV